jgi:hypothetical protein
MSQASNLVEDMLSAIVVKLVRKGVLSRDDLLEISDGFRKQALATMDADDKYRLEELAHTANCLILEADEPEGSDWQADPARSRFFADWTREETE